MKQSKIKKKTVTVFLGFLLLMWLFTLISKSVYASGLPRVTVKKPEKRNIEHTVETEGTVTPGGELAIHVESGLRVQKLYVRTGDPIEVGMPLFQLDVDDLADIIEQKELELAELDYAIADARQAKADQEQKKQQELQRAKEDYDAAKSKADQLVERANSVRSQVDEDLRGYDARKPAVTPQDKREEAAKQYLAWVSRKQELTRSAEAAAALVAQLETPNADGSDKTPEQEVEIEAARQKLEVCRQELTAHEGSRVPEPDFTAEDQNMQSWASGRTALVRAVEQANNSQVDANYSKDAALKQEQRELQDISSASQTDSALTLYQMKRRQKAEDVLRYREIQKQGGLVESSMKGTVTSVGVSVGGRTSDAGAVICVDESIPYRFSAVITREQKKYLNLGDEVTLTFAGSEGQKDIVTAHVDYLMENPASPGNYEAIVNLPEGKGSVGMSGTLNKKYTGESFNICVPVNALVKEYQSVYVYIVSSREGILGEELYVEKVAVTLKDENEWYAALEEGILAGDAQIIVSSTEPYTKGSIVRYE